MSKISNIKSQVVEGPTNLDHVDEKIAEVEEIKDVREVNVDVQISEDDKEEQNKKAIRKRGSFLDRKLSEPVPNDHLEKHEELNWQQVLLNGMEDGEKILLKEYTTILRNYKDVKKRLAEREKKERDSQFDITLQMRELKKSIQIRDD